MRHYILPGLAVVALFTLGLAAGGIPKEICNADYCILEGQTVEQLYNNQN